MDIGRSFTYIFDDENWLTKILLGGLFALLSVILIGIPFVLGYVVETIKNVIDGVPSPLPEWDNLGEKFRKGLMLALLLLIYQIPNILLQCVSGGAMGALAEADPRTAESAIPIIQSCQGCFSLVWTLLVAAITPAVFIKYTLTDDFMAGFRFGELFDLIKADLGNYVIAILLTWVAGVVAMVGLIGLCIGIFFTGFWSRLVQAHLYGQLYRSISAKGEAQPATY
jgi:hypothetical protein